MADVTSPMKTSALDEGLRFMKRDSPFAAHGDASQKIARHL
jgi:hypothetical protein